jgi:hypothetical protein
MNNYFENCETLDEAKKIYRKFAMELHPDKGGKHEDFVELGRQFESFRPKSEKFQNEFSKFSSAEFMAIINQLLNIQGIEVEVCGSWIWIHNTQKEQKDQLKATVCGETYNSPRWSRSKSAWYISPSDYKKRSRNNVSLDKIREMYGSQTMNGKSNLMAV